MRATRPLSASWRSASLTGERDTRSRSASICAGRCEPGGMASAWIRPTICAAMELCDFMRSTVTRFHAASGRSGVSSACRRMRGITPPAASSVVSSCVSTAAIASKASCPPSAQHAHRHLARAAARWPARRCRCGRRARAGDGLGPTAAAGAVAECPCRSGCCGGCARSSAPARRGCPAGAGPGGPVARRSGAVALARDEHHRQPGVAVARRPP